MGNKIEKKLLIGFSAFLGSSIALVLISFAIIGAVAYAITLAL